MQREGSLLYLAPLVLHNKTVLYEILLRRSAETLLEVARDSWHLGAEIGFFSVLHTWKFQLVLAGLNSAPRITVSLQIAHRDEELFC